MRSYKSFLAATALLATFTLFSQNVYLKKAPPQALSPLDHFLYNIWEKEKISPAMEASDAVMVRRLYIDLVGRVPTPEEALLYINDKNPDKQPQLVKKLLDSEEHAIFMTMRLGDELRIKSEFPINLWPNAAFLYSITIYNALRTNMPFDRFAMMMLLSDGSNFRNGYVNFLRAVSPKQPEQIADAAAKFLLGKPLLQLPAGEREKFRQAFSHIRFKSTREWKEEIVYSLLPTADDPRYELIPQIIAGKDFAQTAVKRCWRWIFGSENADPAIVEYLAEDFRKNKFDLRKLMFQICTSAAYRVGSLSAGNIELMQKFAAIYPIRRLDAEVLADSIAQITGIPYSYTSVIPEPFSYYNNRAAALPDGSVSDQFLLLFGRPSRDTGEQEERKSFITADQRLYLFNSTDLNNRLNNIMRNKIRKEKDKLGALYLLFYSRMPTKEERQLFQKMSKEKGWKLLARMPWVLLNSKEFLYQH